MKPFIKNSTLFLLPFLPSLLFSLFLFYIDIFKIFGFYDDFYSSDSLPPNRELVCTKTYNEYNSVKEYDAFILGNSRSNAFQCDKWAQYIPIGKKPFHFDAYNEGTWGILKKLEYIQEVGGNIKEALIIVDESTFKRTKHQSENYLFISMPSISKASVLEYYYTHIKTSLNINFLLKVYGNYKRNKQSTFSKKNIPNPINCDLVYWQEAYIRSDSTAYYLEQIKKGIFYDRSSSKISSKKMSPLAEKQIKKIQEILTFHNTNYKIVISPLYNQAPFHQENLEILHTIFGKKNVYDFSGENEFTTPIGNYYEASHYRPHVADKIMKLIYQ